MFEGRDEHEKKCFTILQRYKEIFDNDMTEIKAISCVAEAHSGKINESKDTISNSELRREASLLSCTYDAKSLAAIVRFSDEICETKERASRFAVESGKVKGKSLICHKYCSYINSVQVYPKSEEIAIEYRIPVEDIERTYSVDGSDLYMIDEICARLDKMNRERVYCCRYFSKQVYYRKIVAKIEIVGDDQSTLHSKRLEIEDKGYPKTITSVKDLYPGFSGEKYSKKVFHDTGGTVDRKNSEQASIGDRLKSFFLGS